MRNSLEGLAQVCGTFALYLIPLLSSSQEYQLFAFISHMGTSTMCGHYVCHIKKDGR